MEHDLDSYKQDVQASYGSICLNSQHFEKVRKDVELGDSLVYIVRTLAKVVFKRKQTY